MTWVDDVRPDGSSTPAVVSRLTIRCHWGIRKCWNRATVAVEAQ